MRDLAILVPSRGRPASVARLIAACEHTCTLDWQLCWAFDDDDPTRDEALSHIRYGERNNRAYTWTGPRQGLAAWTNQMWRDLEGQFRLFGSIGDDHEPITRAWDYLMSVAIERGGGGFAYCNNGGHRPELDWNLPEMCVANAEVLSALGWFAEPSMLHYNIDTVWRDLGIGAECLYYLPDVILTHHNWALWPGRPELRDQTQWDSQQQGRRDVLAYEKWRAERMDADVAKVRKALVRLCPGGRSFGWLCSCSGGVSSALLWRRSLAVCWRVRGGNSGRVGNLAVAARTPIQRNSTNGRAGTQWQWKTQRRRRTRRGAA